MQRIARRYAKALFEQSKGDLAAAKKDLASLQVLEELFHHKDAGKILRSPVMPVALKKSLLEHGLEAGKADKGLKNLVATLLEVGREQALLDISSAYAEMVDAAEGTVKGDVSSAAALGQSELDAIGKSLETLVKKKVVLRPHVDQSLLGGFVARVGNYLVDMSLKTRLDGLAQGAVQDRHR
jgi:F-type H+-transporting ATPase subunit delta